jgi:hypothetical protein
MQRGRRWRRRVAAAAVTILCALSSDSDNNATTGGIMQSGSQVVKTGLCLNEDLKVGRWVNVTYESPPYIYQCNVKTHHNL